MNLSKRLGVSYGLLGLPLAFVALPLYVVLPNHYARELGVPLASLGLVLLAARLLDAFIDPWLGRISDRLFARSPQAILAAGAASAVVLAAGFGLLFFPHTRSVDALLVWAAVILMVTYAAYSFLSVAHQSWGARLGGNEAQRSRIVAWREGLGLVGVLIAAVSPTLLGLPGTVTLFSAALALGWLAWTQAPRPGQRPNTSHPDTSRFDASETSASVSVWLPLRRPAFRRLLTVFVLNGIATAVPATLMLFFVQDRLQAPANMEPLFLGAYFACAALTLSLWLRVVERLGLARTWAVGMVLSVTVFGFAATLGAGDVLGFALVCALSGVALGTDLALPSALLAGVIAQAGDQGHAEGAYFGWWNFATKLNLALAAGLALPLLAVAGYTPGARSDTALTALTFAYCVLPCLLKLLAATGLYTLIIRRST
ncbi:MAG: putative Na+/melibiose symporter [Pseudomonadota bacterium]|jgi:Na+/melibiose symporter-like transporter